MNGNGDSLDDILAMVVFGILGPEYLTGQGKPSEEPGEKDDSPDTSDDQGKSQSPRIGAADQPYP